MADNSSGVKSHLPNVDAVEDELEVEDEDILPFVLAAIKERR